MSPHLIQATRRSLCSAIEDIGGVCTRLSEYESGTNFPDASDEIIAEVSGPVEETKL